jgi:2-amino-4,5-dihydroxy-6-oxo-7-(phosphonooxy)heptanoate synthase
MTLPFSIHPAREVRLRRLFRHDRSRLMVCPLDHAISDGPSLSRGQSLDSLIGDLAAGGVDAVVLHKGALRHVRPERFTALSLIVHLNASTARAPDPDAKYLVTDVAEAVRLGADAVSLHVNLGSADERHQIGDLGRVAELCDRWNLPLLAMMYARGPQISNPRDPELIAHAVTVAVDLGADIVKTVFTGSVAEMRDITAAAPIPVLVAGGPRMDDEDSVLAFVRNALVGGASGVAMGRNIFQAANPLKVAEIVSRLVHHLPRDLVGDLQQEGQDHELKQTVLALHPTRWRGQGRHHRGGHPRRH